MTDSHIKIPAVPPVIRYAANGAQAAFDFPFPVFASEDVAVYLNGARQVSGYDVSGAGRTAGGTVVFDTAPAADTIVTIERRIPLERMTDFIEGGDLSARSLNNELDYLAASIQQLHRDQSAMLRYDGQEAPGGIILPPRAARANRALAFDGSGNLTTVAHGDTLQAPSFVQPGAGAVARGVADKAGDVVSVRDFGAVGDGLADDTVAIQNALAAHGAVFLPAGTYRTSGTIVLGQGQSLTGAGQASVIAANGDGFNVVEMRAGYALLARLKMTGGEAGVKLYGHAAPCVQNTLVDLVIAGARTGIVLDGHESTDNPCYWNSVMRVLVLSPSVHGVHLTKSGAGDTPNANRFCHLRVYSMGADMAGSGIYVAHGDNANSFLDCECNVKGGAAACVRIGGQAASTFLTNIYTESTDGVPNVLLDAGSAHTSIVNLHAMSDGAAIDDLSGGAYMALNAGFPDRARLGRAVIADARLTLLRHDTVYVDAPGVAVIDATLARSVHLVAATNGQITLRLPDPAEVPGAVYTVKKVDETRNKVVVSAQGGGGPDGREIPLGGPYDYVTVLSNGAGWFILSSNRMAGNTRFHDGAGTYDIDMAVDTYLMSAFGGAKTARLPPADAPAAIGRTVHIKKTDVSANAVTVAVQGGGSIDGGSGIVLSGQNQCVSVVSDGAQWFVIHKYL